MSIKSDTFCYCDLLYKKGFSNNIILDKVLDLIPYMNGGGGGVPLCCGLFPFNKKKQSNGIPYQKIRMP